MDHIDGNRMSNEQYEESPFKLRKKKANEPRKGIESICIQSDPYRVDETYAGQLMSKPVITTSNADIDYIYDVVTNQFTPEISEIE